LECGAETKAKANRLVCGKCANWRTTLIGGDELILERVEMETRSENQSMGEAANV
jgi:hydrogenase nickel incorporation protein HypA/HybF